jgi:sigma-B regulation protein RsbU (phosphoserine phosphatase)
VTYPKKAAASKLMNSERAQHELEIGRQIQASFLPATLPQPAGWNIAASLTPAREVSGDFYDVFPLAGGKRMALVMADVCDKGVGAALFMALFRSLLRAFADQHYQLGWMDVLSSTKSNVGERRSRISAGAAPLKNAIDLTNQYIAKNHGDSNMFATVFFGVLDPLTGMMSYINAGHEAPAICNSSGVKARLMQTGPAVGMLPDMQFAIAECEIGPGEMLVAFTDGVLDARNEHNARFGEAAFLPLLTCAAPGVVITRIMDALALHNASAPQYDDISLLIACRDEDLH